MTPVFSLDSNSPSKPPPSQSAQDEETNRVAEKAKRERKEGLQKEVEIKRLKEEYAGLTERKQELQRRVQSHGVYQDFMERVVKMTTVLPGFLHVTKFGCHEVCLNSSHTVCE